MCTKTIHLSFGKTFNQIFSKLNFQQGRSPSVMSSKLPQPQVQTIKLHKNSSGMGLSIVAAKGAGQVQYRHSFLLIN